MRKDLTFSCIIPVFNESSRITPILNTLLQCGDLFEIIIINDGSTDNTKRVLSKLKHPRLRVIHHKKNVGKTRAIFAGITASQGNYIITIDGDLLNLETKHIQSLLDPIRLGNADITISLRENSLGIYKLFLNDFVTGERVVPRVLLEDTKYYTEGPGFGLEVKMNEKIIQGNYRVESIFLPGVIAPRKSYKHGYITGTIGDIRMVRDILTILPVYKLLYQIWYFYRQQKNYYGG